MHVVIGMSGGVDSSVSALLLKQAGHKVTGLFMKNWEDDDTDEYCSTRTDLIDAVSVAETIGIDIEVVNFAAEYKDRVFANFLAEYQAGRTPNPDVLCNAEIKFKAFLDHAMNMGAQAIATGHYARVSRDAEGKVHLLRGSDVTKDQSYFLHRLTQQQLDRVMFPVGHLTKKEVRAIAVEAGLSTAAKKDSTGICFIGERPFREFLMRYLPRTPGPIVNDAGKTLGEHHGLSYYTLGQRQGIHIGGMKGGSGEPWYVARKDMQSNTLTVVQGHEHPFLKASSLIAKDASWVGGAAPQGDAIGAKTRYRQADSPCDVAAQAGEFALQFSDAQWAVTPGQSAVLYRGDECLGGGIIHSAT
jgi:tRNA-uridine 2-sulfurtransferase